ncbi:MAG: beta-N-acetylhexosaminidase [Sporolactobacillus sp.]|jgi:beta-N-acetylhexosaminidase|nr:beta-N-acetylhexosaminidase [Sporolactobacillus sp.]
MIKEDVLRQIGQLMVFGFYGEQMTPELKEMIDRYQVGNIILFSRNLSNPQQIRRLTVELQTEARNAGHRRPLLICTDQENGAVRRLGAGAVALPGAMLLGATRQTDYAYEVAAMTAAELRSVGINWNLAPVVDVNNNPENPVIGTRSFGSDPRAVAAMGAAFMRGLQDNGTVSTLKHFPGHGDTGTDSHLDLPVIRHDLKRLEQIELPAFRHCIDAGAEVVMSAHIFFPALENRCGVPATLSRNILTGLLREHLRFRGVITTDCLEMRAIADRFGTARGAVMALQAGADLVMVSHTYERQRETLAKVYRAVVDGTLAVGALERSLQRIGRLKARYLDWNDALNVRPLPDDVLQRYRKRAAHIRRQGVTLVNQQGLPLDCNKRTLFIDAASRTVSNVEDRATAFSTACAIIKAVNPLAEFVSLAGTAVEALIDRLKERAYQAVVVVTRSIERDRSRSDLVRRIAAASPCPLVALAGKSPYDLRLFERTVASICTYDFDAGALADAVRTLFGLEKVSGSLPVNF